MSENTKPKMQEIGAGWRKTSGAGNTYYKGKLKINGVETEFIMFPEKDKKNEAGPDLRIYLSEPIPAKQEQKAAAPVAKEKPKAKPVPAVDLEDDSDSVPF
jgi:uncharacterized protein (DUF736 family)